MRAILFSLAAGSLTLAACDPTKFTKVENNAPIIAIEKPSSYPRSGYGTVIATYKHTPAGSTASQSRLAVSSGAGSPVSVYSAWDGTEVSLANTAFQFCTDFVGCGGFSGGALAGVSVDSGDNEFCVASSAKTLDTSGVQVMSKGTVLVRCEAGSSMPTTVRVTTPVDSAHFGSTLAAPPESAAVFVTGSPSLKVTLVIGDGPKNPMNIVDTGTPTGRLYFMPQGADPVAISIDLSMIHAASSSELGSCVASVGGFGEAIATASDGADGFYVAAAATKPLPCSSTPTAAPTGVLILHATSSSDSGAIFKQDAFVNIPANTYGRGKVILFADLIGAGSDGKPDGFPDIVIANDPSIALSGTDVPSISIYAGHDWKSTDVSGVTEYSSTPWITIECPSTSGVSCASSLFGASLASGDVDADGDLDLIVGAPGANSVFVLPGDPTTGPLIANASVVTVDGIASDAQLGASVATFQSLPGPTTDNPVAPNRRDEVVAAAPNDAEGALYVFMCTGLTGDTPAVGNQCIPTTGAP